MANVIGEIPTPAPNGSAVTFTVSSAFSAGSTRVYLGGVRQKLGGGNDYTEASSTTITFATAPLTGANLLVDYATP